MTSQEQMQSIVSSKVDEGIATVREFVLSSGEAEVLSYAAVLIRESLDDDPVVACKAQLATLGLMVGYLSALEAGEM